MAPFLPRDVTRRDTGTGKTFSIVFVVIAFLVVAICILWGYFIPKWRFKYGRPSSTRFNCIGGAAKYGPSTPPRAPRYVPRFPSHPGVRGLCKDPSLQIYNPRTETPFGSRTQIGEVVNLRSLTPTPATQRKISSKLKRPTHDYELPKTPGTLSQLALTDGLHEPSLNGDEEFSPQRFMVTPVARHAGRAPPLTKQLALFPTPVSNSTKRFDTLAHPNLLFDKLDKLDSRKVRPSLDGSYFSGSAVVPKGKRYGDRRSNTMIQNMDDVKSKITELSEAEVIRSSSRGLSRTKDIIELPKPVHKHKPKTPMANIRNRYDRYAGGTILIPPRKASLQRRLTPSTEPLTGSASAKSNFAALNTPPTLHTPPTNDSALIPTPLRVRHAATGFAPASPTPTHASAKHISPSESSMAPSPGKLASFCLQKSLKSRREYRKSIGFYHPKSALGIAVTKPKSVRIKRCSWKGSSVYSRDTKAMSILRSPKLVSSNDGESRKALTMDEPSLRRTNSMDLVRSKIDEWNLQTGDLDLPIPSSSDRPQSDVGPRSPPSGRERHDQAPVSSTPQEDVHTTFGLTMPISKIYVGRLSDDVFGDEASAQESGRVLRRVLDMEMTGTKSNISRYYGRTAPGGAEWI
jgi:hypothetical protein